VADVIDLDTKRKQAADQDDDHQLQRKMWVLRRVLQCSRCAAKCARCGAQTMEAGDTRPEVPYSLCPGCLEEYDIFMRRKRGETQAGDYWHNDEWMQVWETWLQHQVAIERYRNSPEFIKLMHDFHAPG